MPLFWGKSGRLRWVGISKDAHSWKNDETRTFEWSKKKKIKTSDLRNAPKGWAVFVRGRDGIIETDLGIYIWWHTYTVGMLGAFANEMNIENGWSETWRNIQLQTNEAIYVSHVRCCVYPLVYTLPKTNIATENGPKPKRKKVFQPSIFMCELVSFRGCSYFIERFIESHPSFWIAGMQPWRVVGIEPLWLFCVNKKGIGFGWLLRHYFSFHTGSIHIYI